MKNIIWTVYSSYKLDWKLTRHDYKNLYCADVPDKENVHSISYKSEFSSFSHSELITELFWYSTNQFNERYELDWKAKIKLMFEPKIEMVIYIIWTVYSRYKLGWKLTRNDYRNLSCADVPDKENVHLISYKYECSGFGHAFRVDNRVVLIYHEPV